MSNNAIEKIEARIAENKSSIKTYADHGGAVRAAGRELKKWEADYGNSHPMEFIEVFLPNVQRWTVVFNMTKWLNASQSGCYLGHFAQRGFYSI